MWNFSLRNLRNASYNSRFARELLGLYYRDGRVYRIPFGPLRGLRMEYDSKMNFHAILGLSDLEVFRVLDKIFRNTGWNSQERVFVDLGGNRGLYALWLSRLACAKKVYTFEPTPHLAAKIRRHLKLNGFARSEVVELACSDKEGKVEFFLGAGDTGSSLVQANAGNPAVQQTITVGTTSLDEFFFGRKGVEGGPDFIKMDIEGGGSLALPGCAECISRRRPLFYIESHSTDEDREIGNVLMRFDYQALRLNTFEWVKYADETHPSPEGVWGYLLLCPTEFQEKIRSALALPPSVRWQRRLPHDSKPAQKRSA